MGDLVAMVVPGTFFTMAALMVYWVMKYRYQTKKAILEKGGDISESKRPFPFLEVGLMAIGIGVGLAIGTAFQFMAIPAEAVDKITGACMLLFGGLGIVIAFFIRRKIDEKR
ncbi:MAG: hypothetical protein ACK5IJ_11680 [Mangrovibacterium sp.]